MGLRQRDGVSCGPAAAVVAGALLDPAYARRLGGPSGRAWFGAEQARIHVTARRVWPRALGTTPSAMAWVMDGHGARHGVRYGWRLARPGDALHDVDRAVAAHWPVAMLVGHVVPRHWVLIVGADGESLQCYEPSSGEVRSVSRAAVRSARLTGLGFARAYAFVVPVPRIGASGGCLPALASEA